MCTAISMIGKDHYFGRNLDLTYHYSEAVTITPRKYTLRFYDGQATDSHYAIIGIATIANGYPLYYDAVNHYVYVRFKNLAYLSDDPEVSADLEDMCLLYDETIYNPAPKRPAP